MKRQSIEHLREIYSDYNFFFWKKCCKCNLEVRRERIWRTLTGPYFGGNGVWRYLCKSCAPNKEAAYDLFEKKPWIPELPQAPKAPPKPNGVVIIQR